MDDTPEATPATPTLPVRCGGAGKGRGGKRVSFKVTYKRYRGNLDLIGHRSIKRVARRAGVKRISGMVYDEARGALKAFLDDVIHDSIHLMEGARRRTITGSDVIYALKKKGRTLYGYGF